VRMPFIYFEIWDHLHPYFLMVMKSSRSSLHDQDPFKTSGLRWFIHFSRQSRVEWKCPPLKNSCKATCFQFIELSLSFKWLEFSMMLDNRRRSYSSQNVLGLMELSICKISKWIIWELLEVKICLRRLRSVWVYITKVVLLIRY
jgi:hypothetical protein